MAEGKRPSEVRGNRSIPCDGAKLREAREQRGLSREALAALSKGPHPISPATIKRAENGDPIFLDTARRHCELLEIALSSVADVKQEEGRQARIAVLPFEIFGSGDEVESFSQGLAADLISRLSRWWFPVISRTSTVAVEVPGRDAMRSALGADYWVSGSVQRASGKISVRAELVDATTSNVVWAGDFDRLFDDVLALEHELATSIVAELKEPLLDRHAYQFERFEPQDLDAWQRALLGAWHFYRRTRSDNEKARQLLAGALKRDQHLALAWYTLALTHQQDLVNQWTPDPRASLAHLHEVSTEFTRLYPGDASSHVVAAYLHVYRGERATAEERLEAAIGLDPNACLAYSLYGQTLAMRREPDKGLEHFEQALRLSPRDPERWSIHTGMALAHFVAERYAETIAVAEEAIRIRPTMAFAYGAKASAHANLGNLSEARDAVQAMLAVQPNTTLRGLSSIISSTDPEIAARYVNGLRSAGLVE